MWGEGECCWVRHQELGPTLNGGWCLSVVFLLEEGAHPKNMIPHLKDGIPPPAAALTGPLQVETTAKLPNGGMASDASTAPGTGGNRTCQLRQPWPTLVGQGFEGFVPGSLQVQELSFPIRNLSKQAVPLRLRQTIQGRLQIALRGPGPKPPANSE